MYLKVIVFASVLSMATLSSTCQAESETEQLPSAEADSPPGHMQPLGSHMEPKPLTRINYMPTPQEFNRKYVSPKQPVIFEGLISNQEVVKHLQSDDYLRTKFGDDVFGTEQRKKENRSLEGFRMTMSKFLDVYKEKDIYMVSDLSPGLYNEWVVPRFLQCGGYAENIAVVLIWFSSGGTKSVLHTDTQENLHCLVSGKKKFVIIEPHFTESIGPEHKKQGFYNIDVERVNMTAYPNLTKIPWYSATLNPGDCLYLPYQWIHHVESKGRNMGINVWWNLFDFNPEDCPSNADQLPEFSPLSDFEPEVAVILRKQLEETKREDGKVYAVDILNEEFKSVGMELEHIKELFEALQPGSKGVLTDIDKIPNEALRKGGLFLMEVFSSHADTEYDLEQSLEERNEEGEEASESEPEWLFSQQERDEL